MNPIDNAIAHSPEMQMSQRALFILCNLIMDFLMCSINDICSIFKFQPKPLSL